MQTITESILMTNDNVDIYSNDFTIDTNFGIVVKSGIVILEMKVGNEYFAVTEPGDIYYRALKMTGPSEGLSGTVGSITLFDSLGPGVIYRLRALVSGTVAQAVTFESGGSVSWTI